MGGQVGIQARAKASTLRTKPVRKRKAKEELQADSLTATQKRREYSQWKDHINSEVDMVRGSDARFNFIKVHIMSHFA